MRQTMGLGGTPRDFPPGTVFQIGKPHPLPSQSLLQQIEQHAEKRPQAIAIVDGKERVTYADLIGMAKRCAVALRKNYRIGRDSVVGVCMERSAQQVAVALACHYLRAVYLPISTRQPAARKTFVAADAEASLLVVDTDQTWMQAGSVDAPALFAIPDAQTTAPADTLEERAYIAYTSGSTGTPKGVQITHKGLANRIGWMIRHYDMGPNDALILKCEIDFDPSLFEIFMPLCAGAKIVVLKGKGQLSAGRLIDIIRDEGITFLNLVPLILRQLIQSPNRADCNGLRHIVCGGEAWSATLVEEAAAAFPQALLYNGYGPTEASIGVTVWRHDPQIPLTENPPIGKPIDNVHAAMVPLCEGATNEGELWIGGLAVSPGYLGNRPENDRFAEMRETDGAVVRYYRTGDIVSLNAAQEFVFVARNDTQVKINGQRIELEEIEAAANMHPAVEHSVARVMTRGPLNVVQLWVKTPVLDAAFRASLMEHLGTRLKPQFLPGDLRTIDALPIGPNGKINRKLLENLT